MSDVPVKTAAIWSSLALAARYFPLTVDEETRPAAPFTQAAFLLSGKYQAWDRWKDLPHEEKQRIARLYAIAPPELADLKKFSVAARALLAQVDNPEPDNGPVLAPFETVGDDPYTAVAAFPRVGGDLFGYVDRTTARFRRPSARPKPLEFAGPGTWLTGTVHVQGHGEVHGVATIPSYPQFSQALEHDRLPHLSSVAYLPDLRVPTPELLDLAGRINQRSPDDERYLRSTLDGLFRALRTTDTVAPAELLRLTAGELEIFNAPTGTGKSVLVRVMAAWFASQGLRIAIVLPDIKSCLAMTAKIRDDLQYLHRTGFLDHEPSCAHLMSASGMQQRAEDLASLIDEDPDAPGEWGLRRHRDIDQLAYGCALKPFIEATGEYPPGQQPCHSLHQSNAGPKACPWIPTCGEHAPVYQAADASVIVMNHYAFMLSKIKIGVNLDGRPVRGLTFAEFALRTCHAVVLDEVDQFQSRAIDNCASEITLHSRRHWTAAPQELDTDSKRLRIDDEHDFLPAVSQVRLMAESLLLGICQGALSLNVTEDERAQDPVPDQTSTRWHLARARDRILLRILWPHTLNMDLSEIPEDLAQQLDDLMPARYRTHAVQVPTRLEPASSAPRAETSATTEYSAPVVAATAPSREWPRIRQALSALVAPRGEHLLDAVKVELHEILSGPIKDPHQRARAVNLLVLRAVMLELDEGLSELQGKAQRHRSSGLRSAQRIVERMQSSAMSKTQPAGLLGRTLTGYRVTGLDDREKNAELVGQTIGGDPHTFTAQLGAIVSLVLAGVERPVMGLSATSYFPQAVREHVHAPVRWWMTDAQADSIRARKHRIDYGHDHPLFGEPIKISGTHPSQKKHALIELGTNLYDLHVHRELERTAVEDPDRAHVLIVANSYQQCGWIAHGIARSGRFDGGLCVAVRKSDRHSSDPDLPRPSVATRLTGEEFEQFPQHGKILVVPLALIARGLNIVKNSRSAVRSVYLCVRPLALLNDIGELYASVNAAGIRTLPPAGVPDPATALALAADAAWEQLRLILRTAAQFTAMHKSLQDEIVAGMIVDLIQLAGRARRGGTEAVLHLVDYAFHEDTWSADLETVLRRIHSQWPPDVRQRMNDLYGEALNAFLSYAGIDTSTR